MSKNIPLNYALALTLYCNTIYPMESEAAQPMDTQPVTWRQKIAARLDTVETRLFGETCAQYMQRVLESAIEKEHRRIAENEFTLALKYVLSGFNPGPWEKPVILQTNFGDEEAIEWGNGTPHTATHLVLYRLLEKLEEEPAHLETIARVIQIAHQNNQQLEADPSLADRLAHAGGFHEHWATIYWNTELLERMSQKFEAMKEKPRQTLAQLELIQQHLAACSK